MSHKTPMPYFSVRMDNEVQAADIYIFGDIAHNRGGLSGLLQAKSDQSSYDLANQVMSIPEDWEITVHINSNGGELKEGLGIYNVLKERNVTTICEGFAASAGSVIFAAGKRRIMQPASLLFIHQASMEAGGNADDFQKAADDLRIITDAAVAAYMESGINISSEELHTMLQAETWITPEDAVRMGFATSIVDPDEDDDDDPDDSVPIIRNDAMMSIMGMITQQSREPEEKFKYDDFISDILDTLDGNPELTARIKDTVKNLLNDTNLQPSPARDGNKGFFNF